MEHKRGVNVLRIVSTLKCRFMSEVDSKHIKCALPELSQSVFAIGGSMAE
jgi:hypothetical protein